MRGGVCVIRKGVCAYVCMRARCFHARVWKKKRSGARARGRGDVDIFLRATRECRERHAFDWPRVVGSAAGEQGGGEGGGREDER